MSEKLVKKIIRRGKIKMKTEKEIREIYEEEKKNLDDCVLDDNDYYILQGWVEALKCVLS